MTEQDKKIHDFKFELRQQRQRIDILEQRMIKLEKLDEAHRKLHATIQMTDYMQKEVITDVIDLIKDIQNELESLKKEDKDDR